ncbi:MAG: transcription elongation factor GreA [Anaerolineales bacterium]|nr:MAG: transcription elongation factor GreA [Anaerolineales bacterium]
MAEEGIFLTLEGRGKLEEELEYLLTVRRAEVAERIQSAKEEGDITENAAYDYAKEEQAFVEGRIQALETTLRQAVIIEDGSTDDVGLGARVTVMERGGDAPETYQIVGSVEADPTKGRISNESPIGKALLGHQVGDEVAVSTPGGISHFQVLSIE